MVPSSGAGSGPTHSVLVSLFGKVRSRWVRFLGGWIGSASCASLGYSGSQGGEGGGDDVGVRMEFATHVIRGPGGFR
eukprot:9213892-Pyramimonas_sp.AAC.1